MPEAPHTLLIGDPIVGQLQDAWAQMPGTGAFWPDPSFWEPIGMWANGGEIRAFWDSVSSGSGAEHRPDKMPDTAVVSLGRYDIIYEDDQETLASNVSAIVDQIKALGITKIAWVLPPAIKGEGRARQTIEGVLAGKGVRVFRANQRWSDSSTIGAPAQRLPDNVIEEMASLLATWLPLGPPRGPVGPRRPGETSSGGSALDAIAAPAGFLGRLSRPAKFGLAAALLVGVGGGIYAARRARG